MPEGPEVETIRRTLEAVLVGETLGKPWVSALALRTPIRARDLRPIHGARVTRLGRHGKLLWIDVDSGAGVMVRLGMSGRLVVSERREPRPLHTHVRVTLASSGRELRYVDARRFGEVVPYADAAARDEEVARMGPDGLALTSDDERMLVDRFARTTRALKDVLLDQSILAGLGNIYAAEALFDARLSPFARADSISGDDVFRLLAASRAVLERGVAHRGTSFSDYVDGTGAQGSNQDHLSVFQREGEPCRVCNTTIERHVQGQRSTFLCPVCQR